MLTLFFFVCLAVLLLPPPTTALHLPRVCGTRGSRGGPGLVSPRWVLAGTEVATLLEAGSSLTAAVVVLATPVVKVVHKLQRSQVQEFQIIEGKSMK